MRWVIQPMEPSQGYGIIQQPEVLVDSWLPSDLIGREAQPPRLLTELGQNGSKLANHAVLWGDPVTGKTATARTAAARLENHFLITSVSCLRETTPYFILAKALDTLRILPQDRSRDFSSRLEVLEIAAQRRRIVLVLDEFHTLPPRDRALLLRALSEIENLSIVCIVPSLDAI